MKHKFINKIVVIGSILTLFPLTTLADSATSSTAVNLTISAPGGGANLQITAPGPVTITGKNVSTTTQYSSGTLTAAEIGDVRGTLTGWNVTASMTNLATTTVPQNANGSIWPSAVSFTGTSTCMQSDTTNGAASHTLTIGSSNDWTIRRSNAVSTTGTGNTVNFGDGVIATLSAGTTTGAIVRIPISCSFYSQASSTPSSLTGLTGANTYGVTTAVAALFAGTGTTSNAMTIVTADEGTGNGGYTYNLGLGITVLQNSAAGIHTGTLTLTIS